MSRTRIKKPNKTVKEPRSAEVVGGFRPPADPIPLTPETVASKAPSTVQSIHVAIGNDLMVLDTMLRTVIDQGYAIKHIVPGQWNGDMGWLVVTAHA